MIDGFNHVVFVTNDMEQTARFYCDVLGFRIKATVGNEAAKNKDALNFAGQLAPTGDAWTRIYFFEVGERDTLAFVEVPGLDTKADPSQFSPLWPGQPRPPARPQKLDHLAFNVADRERLIAIQKHLRDVGVTVSEIGSIDGPPFVKSIYFYDPNGIALEVATWDFADPAWAERTHRMFHDPNPVPTLRAAQGKNAT